MTIYDDCSNYSDLLKNMALFFYKSFISKCIENFSVLVHQVSNVGTSWSACLVQIIGLLTLSLNVFNLNHLLYFELQRFSLYLPSCLLQLGCMLEKVNILQPFLGASKSFIDFLVYSGLKKLQKKVKMNLWLQVFQNLLQRIFMKQ